MSKPNEHPYRFALYGEAESGKTCIVGILALGETHPGSGTCTRIPLPQSGDGQNEPASSLNPTERDADCLRLGKVWIDAAVEALRAHRPVLATPVSPDERGGGLLPMVDLKFGHERRGEFRVRMVDYSGELVGKVAQHDAAASAAALKTVLAKCDGLLILGEAPTQDNRLASAGLKELSALREAFAGLAESGERWDRTPVAVLVPKWDRLGPIEFDEPAAERPKLEAFLASHPRHNELVKEIRNTMVGQPDAAAQLESCAGLRWGNTAVFACSAFGQATIDSDASGKPCERRADDGRPFGLIEPFVWLADRRDELDVNAIHQWYDRTRRSVEALCCWKWWYVAQEASRTRARLPRKSTAAERVERTRRKALYWMAGTALALAFTVSLITSSVWGGKLRSEFRSIQTDMERPDADVSNLDGLRGRLESLRGTREKLPLAPKKDELAQAIHAIDDRIDGLLWAPIEKAKTLPEKAKHASLYLGKLPNGTHSRDATVLVSENESTNQRQQNADFLARMKDAESRVEDEPGLGTFLKEFDRFPVPELADQDQWAEFHQLRREAEKRRAVMTAQRSWEEFVKQYRDGLVAERWTEAAELLAVRKPRTDEWKSLVGKFPTEVASALRNRTTMTHSYEDASAKLNLAEDSLKLLESSLRPDDPALADQALTGQRTLSSIRLELDKNYDRTLYFKLSKANETVTLADCDTYLKKAPLKGMRKQVEAYKTWLEAMEKPLTLAVSVSVLWDAGYSYGNDNKLEVFLDDVSSLKTTNYFPAAPGKESGALGQIEIKAKTCDAAVKIRGAIIEVDTFVNDDGGQGHATLKLKELIDQKHSGARIPLPTSGGTITNQLVLRIVGGLPPKPEMPTWQSKSSP